MLIIYFNLHRFIVCFLGIMRTLVSSAEGYFMADTRMLAFIFIKTHGSVYLDRIYSVFAECQWAVSNSSSAEGVCPPLTRHIITIAEASPQKGLSDAAAHADGSLSAPPALSLFLLWFFPYRLSPGPKTLHLPRKFGVFSCNMRSRPSLDA